MYFNSIDFLAFVSVFFFLYWFVFNKRLAAQNTFITIASYFFYGWWDWRFLILIFISSSIDFFIGKALVSSKQKNRKLLLAISLISNLGLLFFFKYFNFFIESFVTAFSFIGFKANTESLEIILPVGISFYTFQTLSYTIDIYRNKLKPVIDPIHFFAFVSFFPQLVAGPIERASAFLPQFSVKRSFQYDKAVDGLRQFLWGLFKKVVIADNAASILNPIFENHATASSSELILASFLFSIQIYCDFSGYSDMAIGISRLFGFNLKQNFRFPYFSKNISEFWRRWHISLSTWFRDYLYIPLGGSQTKTIRNLTIVFLISALWHGANWTFIFWGVLHVIYFIASFFLKKSKNLAPIQFPKSKLLAHLTNIVGVLITFLLVTFAWIFFRSETVQIAFDFISGLIYNPFWTNKVIENETIITLSLVGIMLFMEWKQRKNEHCLSTLVQRKTIFRWSIYFLIGFAIFLFKGNAQSFIYFQF